MTTSSGHAIGHARPIPSPRSADALATSAITIIADEISCRGAVAVIYRAMYRCSLLVGAAPLISQPPPLDAMPVDAITFHVLTTPMLVPPRSEPPRAASPASCRGLLWPMLCHADEIEPARQTGADGHRTKFASLPLPALYSPASTISRGPLAFPLTGESRIAAPAAGYLIMSPRMYGIAASTKSARDDSLSRIRVVVGRSKLKCHALLRR